jgi:uncharacterized membrane protein YagU involved in acid resistance
MRLGYLDSRYKHYCLFNERSRLMKQEKEGEVKVMFFAFTIIFGVIGIFLSGIWETPVTIGQGLILVF